MSGAQYNIEINQGAQFQKTITWKTGDPPESVDLSGWTAEFEIKQSYHDPSVDLLLTVGNGGIILGGVEGTIRLKATSTQTAALTFRKGVFTLDLIPPSGAANTRRLLQGKVIVTPG